MPHQTEKPYSIPKPIGTYEEALALLKEVSVFGINPSLDRIRLLVEALGNPHQGYPSIQIAGTNGKSSTARFCASILSAHGLKTGLYTSPELMYYEERIEVDQHIIPREDFAKALNTVYETATQLTATHTLSCITEFELITAAALWYFAREKVDVAVLEVGMGGRWDATSVVDPVVAVVTGIGLDHTAILGNTLEEIAEEKAAIIKQGCVPVLGPGTMDTLQVFKERLKETGTTAFDLTKNLLLAQSIAPALLLPSYQVSNIACAVSAAEALLKEEVSEGLLFAALATTALPGRFETIRQDPLLIIDAAHNPQSAGALAKALKERFGEQVPGVLLLAILADKDADGIIDALSPLFSTIAVTTTSSVRALTVEDLAVRLRQRFEGGLLRYKTIEDALNDLTASGTACIATGSITLAGDVKRLITKC